MIITWTPTGGSLVYLGDDNNAGGSGKIRTTLDTAAGAGLEQFRNLAFATNPARNMRGNVGGDIGFSTRQSFSSRDTAASFFKTAYGYIAQQGTLQITFDAGTWTMANATFKGLKTHLINGLEWGINYTFGITTLT